MIQDSEPPSLLSSTADSVKSSEMQKKIRRKHFKNDSAVKAYKCDLISQNINTPVKLYVCHSALNLVHRPKRKIMTTLPYSQVVELKIHDEKLVKIYTVSNEMYTLTNFDRPDSAIAFLRNYWEVILKEKTFSTSTYGNSMHNGLPNINNSNNNPLSAHRNAVVADLYNRLLISKGSTTVSLTSTSGGATGSISNSETDSVTGSQRQEIDIPKCTLALRKPASESSNLSKLDNSIDMDPRVQSTNLVELTNTAATTTTTTTTATTPTATSTPITAMAIASPTPPPTSEMSSSSSSFLGSITNSFSFPTVSSSLNMGKDSICHRQKVFNNSEGINNNTNNNISNNNNNKSHHNVSTDWNWWPLNLLTCMFSSTPPQRFTMLIAYAILGFLFLSTVHLYHRLALIDLQTGPAVRRSGIIPSHSSLSSPSASSSYSHSSSSSSSELHNLELQLTHLTQLASKMVDGLSHLTSELNSLMTVYSNPEKFSPDQSTLNT